MSKAESVGRVVASLRPADLGTVTSAGRLLERTESPSARPTDVTHVR